MTRITIHSWHQQTFDDRTLPSSPSLSLQIAGPDAHDWANIAHALIDTGADATIVPDSILSKLAVVEWDKARLRSQGGEYRPVYRYEVDLRISGRVFASVLVVADELSEDVIIGRDILNRLRFLYDGPSQQLLLVE